MVVDDNRRLWVQSLSLDKLLLESEAATKVHSAVLQLGLQYVDGSITGANARCLAMLQAFCQVIEVRTWGCIGVRCQWSVSRLQAPYAFIDRCWVYFLGLQHMVWFENRLLAC